MGETISDRARVLFSQARQKTKSATKQVLAEHSRDGLLNSGKTVKRLVEIHNTMTRHAIREATESIGRRVQSRGRWWRGMIEDVRRELDTHITDAEQAMKSELQKVVTSGPNLVEPLLIQAREQFHRDLEDYEQGWAGTPGKPWSERHKVLYTLLVALGGAASAKLVETAFKIGN